jgi:hypothetical protein
MPQRNIKGSQSESGTKKQHDEEKNGEIPVWEKIHEIVAASFS